MDYETVPWVGSGEAAHAGAENRATHAGVAGFEIQVGKGDADLGTASSQEFDV